MYHRFVFALPTHFLDAVDGLRASANCVGLCHRLHRYPAVAYIRWFGPYWHRERETVRNQKIRQNRSPTRAKPKFSFNLFTFAFSYRTISTKHFTRNEWTLCCCCCCCSSVLFSKSQCGYCWCLCCFFLFLLSLALPRYVINEMLHIFFRGHFVGFALYFTRKSCTMQIHAYTAQHSTAQQITQLTRWHLFAFYSLIRSFADL